MNPVFINGTFLGREITGVERYSIEIIKALDSLSPDGYVLLAPKDSASIELKHIPLQRVGTLKGKLWEQIELPIYSRRGLLFSPFPAAPLLKRDHVVTVHDAVLWVYPKAYSFTFRAWYKAFIPLLGKVARSVLTDTAFSLNELNRYPKIAKEKMRVVPCGYDHVEAIEADDSILERLELRRPFVLAVGSANPTKNLGGVIKAFGLLNDPRLDLVIVGSKNSRIFSEIESTTLARWTGYLNDRELKALYQNARCFVQASFYEGFGLPPLEAIACGCPVVVSRAASLPEVMDGAAIYCDPSDAEDIAAKMRLALETSPQRDVVDKVLSRFRWRDAAAKLKNELERLRYT